MLVTSYSIEIETNVHFQLCYYGFGVKMTKHVLLIDDEISFLRNLKDFLEDFDCIVHTAINGNGASDVGSLRRQRHTAQNQS